MIDLDGRDTLAVIKPSDYARTMENSGGHHEQTRFAVTPHWYGGDLAPDVFSLPPELRRRLREWNRTWMNDLNPELEIRWPTLGLGRRWVREGHSLIEDLQVALGPDYRVVSGFEAYDPDSPSYEGTRD